MLLKAGRYAEAEKVFRADLAKNIGNPRSLYGLYRALEGQKKAAAAEAKASFDKAWAGATCDDLRVDVILYALCATADMA